MSEREVRKYARHTEDCCVVSYLGAKALVPCDCGYLDAMKEPLDLERLVEWLRAERIRLEEARKRPYGYATPAYHLQYLTRVVDHIAEMRGKDGS